MEKLPFRQIHLDFHTSPLIEGVGEDFDCEEFVRTLKEAYVNSINIFAKCHHGMSYYPTEVGKVHPHLKGDLLGEMIAACHRESIRAPVYISVAWDEYAASQHQDWLQVDKGGELAGRLPLGDTGWRFLCMNSPYVDYLSAQTEEILKNYEVDGIWFDIVFQAPPGCICNYCLAGMREKGLDPSKDGDLVQYNLEVTRGFMQKMSRLVWDIRPEIGIFYNGRIRMESNAQNGLRPELPHFSHLEIESLPSGGWEYGHFPYFAHYCKTLGKEILGMTGRFHKSWADFGGIKNEAALEYECFRALAYGAKCSIGDQLHPKGKLNKVVYKRIGKVYKSVAEKEPWCKKASPVSEIGLLCSDRELAEGIRALPESDQGAMRMLIEMHYQFDVIDRKADFKKYELIVAPDLVSFDPALTKSTKSYLERGGKLILSYKSGLDEDGKGFVLSEIGNTYLGEARYCPDYIKIKPEIAPRIGDMDYVMYERGSEVKPLAGTDVLAYVGHPYFNRTWKHFSSHRHTPLARISGFPAISKRENVIYIASPIFKAYRLHGNLVYKRIVQICLDLLLPKRLVSSNLPSTAEVTLLRQDKCYVLHILHYIPERRTPSLDIIEDIIPLYNVELKVRTERRPSRVYIVPQKEDINFDFEGKYVSFKIRCIQGHQMVIMEE